MRAARLVRQGEPLVIVEIPTPEPGDDELLLKLDACGVCHTDLHIRAGDEPVPDNLLPLVLGHEGIGRVVRIGRNVKGFSLGERIGAPWFHDTCLSCRDCLTGHESVCTHQRAHGWSVNGAFAEYVVVKAAFAVPIPDNLESITAAPLLCAGVTAYGAVRKADLKPGDVCAIFGCGGLGQYAVQIARLAGAHVIAIDTDANRLEQASTLGAGQCILFDDAIGDTRGAIGGVDACINFAPNPRIWPAVERVLNTRGRFVSVAMPKEPVKLSLKWLTWLTPIITGASVGGRQELREMLALANEYHLSVPVEKIRLADVNLALDRLSGRPGLPLINGRLVIDFETP